MKDRKPKSKAIATPPDGAKILLAQAAVLEINFPLGKNAVYFLGNPDKTDPNV